MGQARNGRKIVILAGPNGSGKSTFAGEFLSREGGCPNFINADMIARGLSPFAPETAAMHAGRIMLGTMADHVRRMESFAFETTLAGLNYARWIPVWRRAGYYVKLIFLSLSSADLAVQRVRNRIGQGGHPVEEVVIRRRFDAGLRNFENIYKLLVDGWKLYDNSGHSPRLVMTSESS